MISKKLQVLMHQTMEIIQSEIGIIDETRTVIASSDVSKIDKPFHIYDGINSSEEEFIALKGYLFQRIFNKGKLELVCYLQAENSEENKKLLELFSFTVLTHKKYLDERYDKFNFIKNILMDNILPADIPVRTRELNLQNNISRIVYLVKIEKNDDISLYNQVYALFPKKGKDFVISIDEETCVVVKELDKFNTPEAQQKVVYEIAKYILDSLHREISFKVWVGIGSVAKKIKEIGTSYKEAQLALLVGGIFYDEKTILSYETLGIGRLIYQLPKTLCKLFLDEIFKDKMQEILDTETISTFEKLCECSFNLSETARALFLHRNTLIYRIEKVKEATGLDLRIFEDAVIFKVAMMVKKYLENIESSVY